MKLDPYTFKAIQKIVYTRSGIVLNDKKEALVSGRIAKRLRALNLPNYRSYLDYLTADKTGEELTQMLDAISTNVTSFFRENDHYIFLQNIFRKWVDQGQKRFRFWSAACSSGEEPYSMAMTMVSVLESTYVDLKILATDISTRVLLKSQKGIYPEKSVRTVNPKYKNRFFRKVYLDSEEYYSIDDSIKKLITFRQINLSQPPFPMKGPLDTVFCCNVMIYFDNIIRKKLIDEIYRLLKPGGYLILGHAESLAGIENNFTLVQPSIYIKK